MQAFYFSSGIGTARCDEAPQDGILIQTPSGAGSIELLVNEVSITLGSTAFLQAQSGGSMTISMLEGQAQVSAFDRIVQVPAGTQAVVPLDAIGAAAGVPTLGVQPDTGPGLAGMLSVLPQTIEVAEPLSAAEIEQRVSQPMPGQWAFIYANTGRFPCLPDSEFTHRTIPSDPTPITLRLEADGTSALVFSEGFAPRSEDGVTFVQTGDRSTWTFTFSSTTPTTIEGYAVYVDSCPYEGNFTMTYIGPAGEPE
jgi:hypothetical protein